MGKQKDWQPKAMITLHAVAVKTNLQENEGTPSFKYTLLFVPSMITSELNELIGHDYMQQWKYFNQLQTGILTFFPLP